LGKTAMLMHCQAFLSEEKPLPKVCEIAFGKTFLLLQKALGKLPSARKPWERKRFALQNKRLFLFGKKSPLKVAPVGAKIFFPLKRAVAKLCERPLQA
jgi:hypothetical protein